MTRRLERVKHSLSKLLVSAIGKATAGRSPRPSAKAVAQEGKINSQIRCLVGTKTGLCFLEEGRVRRFFDGRTYGIARKNDRWYAAVNKRIRLGNKPLSTVGELVSFTLSDSEPEDIRVELSNLSSAIHQVVGWRDSILLADTPFNRIIELCLDGDSCKVVRHHYPVGQLSEGRASKNYVHLNSFGVSEDRLYALFHNDTLRTSRRSVVVELNTEFKVARSIETGASCAHNIHVEHGSLIVLDSRNGALLRSGVVVFQGNCFLRGLVRLPQGWLVGGSDFAPRQQRRSSTGFVFHLDEDFQLLEQLTLPEIGSIYDIQAL